MNALTAIDSLSRMAAIIGQAVDLFSVKGYAQEYHERLSEAVVGVFNGDRSQASLAGIHKQLIREYARDIYPEGMSDGGIDDAENELDDDDQARITEFINDQISHVSDFAQAVADTRQAEDQTAAQSSINRRVEIWAQRMEAFGNEGRLRAQDGIMARWKLGDTEKHCADCLHNSNRSPQRVRVWRENIGLPQNPDLACSGINCDCSLVSAKTGKVLFPL